jgi:hypothetical protein
MAQVNPLPMLIGHPVKLLMEVLFKAKYLELGQPPNWESLAFQYRVLQM